MAFRHLNELDNARLVSYPDLIPSFIRAIDQGCTSTIFDPDDKFVAINTRHILIRGALLLHAEAHRETTSSHS